MIVLITAMLGAPEAQAADGELSASLLGGAFFAHSREVVGTSGAIAPRVGYWPQPELGFELDVPVLFGGKTKIDGAGNQPWTGALPNLGIVGRIGADRPVSLLLGASVGATLKGVKEAGSLGIRPTSQPDLDFALLAGPGVLVELSDALHLRAEWRGIVNVGPLGGTEDFGSTRDIFLDGMLLAGVTWLKSGPPDADRDGVPDEVDGCPSDPEDEDGFQDEDGCPDPDNDGDTVADDVDQCDDVAEDLDGFEDEDGCPDPDNDGDGIADADDRCPMKAGVAALKGCPDRDGDGVADRRDECPDVPGMTNAFGCPDRDGDRVPDGRDACPDDKAPDGIDARRSDGCPKKYYIAENSIVILEQVQFLSARATIQRASYDLLDGVADVLKRNPGVKRIQIEGHTDSQGGDDTNLRLSQARADAVKAYLVGKGVEEERLVAKGFGETKPIADNATSAGRQENRRVEFNILEQDLGSTEVKGTE